MGLAGRKIKQRIPEDPRNLSWADNAARFGSSYLAKFGWDASKGLGATGDGRTSHIKVSHKLDMLGIGAANQKDPNGIAWKQNKEFENLLRRLNAASESEGQTPTPVEKNEVSNVKEPRQESDDENVKSEEKEKKRKRSNEGGDEGDKKEKKKKRKTDDDDEDAPAIETEPTQVKEPTPPPAPRPRVAPRHRAHRARVIASKNIASKSAAAISEILGIAPSASSSASSSGAATPSGKLTSVYDDDMKIDHITTSTKSMADYFKEKLSSKTSSGSDSSTSAVLMAEESEADDRPRGGLGSSRVRFQIQEPTEIKTERTGLGLSKFSSLMSSSFLAVASSFSMGESASDTPKATSESVSEDESDREEKKNARKEKENKKKDKEGKLKKKEGKEGKSKKKDKERKKKRKSEDDTENEEYTPQETATADASADEKSERRRRKEEKKMKKAQKWAGEASE